MKKSCLLFLLLVIGPSLAFAKQKKAIDDWDSNATIKKDKVIIRQTKNSGSGMGGDITPVQPMAMTVAMPKKIGLAVGGAKDSHNFNDNIRNGYLPKIDAITYEGTYYQHYFDTGLQGECHALFCPSYSQAITRDIYTDETYHYLSVGLNSGIDQADFKRPKLNLVVVLDISGSMGARFNRYYYDHGKKTKNSDTKSKMQIANEAIVSMMKHLKPEDRFGVVLFDHEAYPVKPLRKVAATDMEAIKGHILALREKGGTNWSAGYKMGLHYFDNIPKEGYENRIIFITDAMPNSGELNKDRLFGMAKHAAKKGIHTTYIGVGVDFNPNLVEAVSKTRGSNYYAIHSSKEFRKRMDAEFDYMVTPLVYDLTLKLASAGYKIDAVYGSPQAKLSTGEIMRVHTLFPSASDGTRNKGGVILLRLKKTGQPKDITLSVSYQDIRGKRFHNTQKVILSKTQAPHYDNNGIRKAILLAEYVTLMKNWIIDMRAGCNDTLDYAHLPPEKIMQRCMQYPPLHPLYPKLKTWERRSCKLKVSKGYAKIFSLFRRHFDAERRVLGDKSLNQEFKILKTLLKGRGSSSQERLDDWKGMR